MVALVAGRGQVLHHDALMQKLTLVEEWASTSAVAALQVPQKRFVVNPRGSSAAVAMTGGDGNESLGGGTMRYGSLAGAQQLSATKIVLAVPIGQGQAVEEAEELELWPSVAVSVELENKERRGRPLQGWY